MKKRSQWWTRVLLAAAVLVGMGVVLYRAPLTSPSPVEQLVVQHQELGRKRWPAAPPAPDPTTRRYALRQTAGHIGFLGPSWEGRQQEPDPADPAVCRQKLEALPACLDHGILSKAKLDRDAFATECQTRLEWYDFEFSSDDLAGGWGRIGGTVDRVVQAAGAKALGAGSLEGANPNIFIWVAADAFAKNREDEGMALARLIVAADLEAPAFYSIRDGAVVPPYSTSEGFATGDSASGTVALLLVLDATDAPRKAFVEILRMLTEEAATDERRLWLAEETTLQLQREAAAAARARKPWLKGRSMVADVAQWTTFQALHPYFVARTEKLLDAWRQRDSKRLAALEAVDALPVPLPVGGLHFGLNGPISADKWQYILDCSGTGHRAAPLEMARFVAAAMLFRRDHARWPSRAEEVVPDYLAKGAIDPDADWFVMEVGPLRTYRRLPYDSDFGRQTMKYVLVHKRLPRTYEELASTARPEDNAGRFADRFHTLPARPVFCRVGKVDPCSAAVAGALFNSEAVGGPGEEQIRKTLAGEEAETIHEAVGFARVPPEGLLRIVSGGEQP